MSSRGEINVKDELFKNVQFYCIQKINDQTRKLLLDGGAKESSYLAGLVTVAISDDPSLSEVEEAMDVFDIPVVTTLWITLSAKCRTLLPKSGFLPNNNQLFSQVVACFSQLSASDRNTLWAMISFHGGRSSTRLDGSCTHLLTTSTHGAKYDTAIKHANAIRIVTPDWAHDSLRKHKRADEDAYHPKLLIVPPQKKAPSPPPPAKDTSATASIVSPLKELSFLEEINRQLDMAVDDRGPLSAQLQARVNSALPLARQTLEQNKAHTMATSHERLIPRLGLSSAAPTIPAPTQRIRLPVDAPPLQMKSSQWMTQQMQGVLGHPPSLPDNLAPLPQPSVSPQTGLQTQVLQKDQSIHQQQQQQLVHQHPVVQQQPHPMVRPPQHQQQIAWQQQQQQQQPAKQVERQPRPPLTPAQQLQWHQNQVQQQITTQQQQQLTPQQQLTQQHRMQTLVLQQRQLQQQRLMSPWPRQVAQSPRDGTAQFLGPPQAQQPQMQRAMIVAGQRGIPAISQQQQQQLLQQQQQLLQQQQIQQQQLPNQLPNQSNWFPRGQRPQQNLAKQQNWQQVPHQGGQLIPTSSQQLMQQQQVLQQQQRVQQSGDATIMVQNTMKPQQVQQQQQQQQQQQHKEVVQQTLTMQQQQQPLTLQQQQPLTLQQQQQQPLTLQQQPLTLQQQQQQPLPLQQQQHQQPLPLQQPLTQQQQPLAIQQQQQQPLTVTHQQHLLERQRQQQQIANAKLQNQQLQQHPQQQQQVQQQQQQQQQGQLHPQLISQPQEPPIHLQPREAAQASLGPRQLIPASWQQTPPPNKQGQWTQQQQASEHLVHLPQSQNVRWHTPQTQQHLIQVQQQQQQQGQSAPVQSSLQQQPQRQLVPQRVMVGVQGMKVVRFPVDGNAQQMQQVRQVVPTAITQQQQQQQQQQQHNLAAIQIQQQQQLHQQLQQQQQQQEQHQLHQQQLPTQSLTMTDQNQQAPRDSLQQAVQMGQEQIRQQLQSLANQMQVQPQVVTPKTKTALANLLNNRLQGTLKMPDNGDLPVPTAGAPRLPIPPAQVALQQQQQQQQQLQAQQQQGLEASADYQRTLRNITNNGQPQAQRPPQQALVPKTVNVGGKPANIRLGVPAGTSAVVHSVVGPLPLPRVQFYGHDPIVRIPPDACLIGCVFYFVEYDKLVDVETVEIWKKVVAQHGGEVEETYSVRCTHVLCDNQRNSIVQQAMREGKRCVTAHWLNDSLLQKRMCPPWLALHFPTPFGDDRPCKNDIMTVSNFEGVERQRLKYMITLTGAKYTGYMTKCNDRLICKRPEGEKCETAREWKIACVNVQWLHDVLFGHYDALRLPSASKYQQFNADDPFRVDYALVPHLMAAWRVPIRASEETWKKFVPNPEALAALIQERNKRKALEDEERNVNKKKRSSPLLDENITITTLFPPKENDRPIVLFTGVKGTTELARRVRELGGAVAQTYKECSHLVADSLCRTVKYLCAISVCNYVVTKAWLLESAKQNRFVDEKPYILSDPANEQYYCCSIKQAICRPNNGLLFKGFSFYFTPGVKPGVNVLKEIVECAGGVIVSKRPATKEIIETNKVSQRLILITCENDSHLCTALFKKNIPIYNVEFVLTGVMRQEVDFESFIFPAQGQS